MQCCARATRMLVHWPSQLWKWHACVRQGGPLLFHTWRFLLAVLSMHLFTPLTPMYHPHPVLSCMHLALLLEMGFEAVCVCALDQGLG